MNQTFIVTGATGFIGGFLTAELVRRKQRVIALARPRFGRTAGERVQAVMEFSGIEAGEYLKVVEVDLSRADLGLDKSGIDRLSSEADQVIHCAAETSFAERKRDQTEKVNITGLENIFSALSKCGHFHYMSTAYAAGRREGLIIEQIHESEGFHNPYEASKHRAELLITRLCKENGVRLTIYRPSIVYGDSVSGKSLRFNALYYPVRIILMLKNNLEKDIIEGSGKRAEELGMVLDDNGVMRMPITVADTGGHIDLIPIDHLIRCVTEIMNSGRDGIFQIVDPQKNDLAYIIELIKQTCGVTGLSCVPGSRIAPPTALEKMIDGYMDLYYPYLCDKRIFDDANTAQVLEKSGLVCPVLDIDSFKRCVDFAVEKDFGSRLRI